MIDRNELLENFTYCPDSGEIRWRSRGRDKFKTNKGFEGWNRKWAGKLAFNTEFKVGYLAGTINRKKMYAHRAAFLMHFGFLPEEIDHINGKRTDNRIVNLRPVDRIENSHNLGRSKRNKSGFPGVHKIKKTGHYTARISVNWKQIYLGYFRNLEDAVAARKEAEEQYGYHQNHGNRKATG